MESLDYAGLWWLPESPDQSIAGTLILNAERGGELKLLGSLQERHQSDDDFAPEIILGVAETGAIITLYGCVLVHTKITMPGLETTRLTADVVLIGHHFSKRSDVAFSRFGVQFEYLGEWAKVTGISTTLTWDDDRKTITEFSARRSPPRNHEIDLSAIGIKRLRFASNFRQDNQTGSLRWDESLLIYMEFEHPVQLEVYLNSFMYHIQNFLTLGIGVPIRPTKIEGRLEFDGKPKERIEIRYGTGKKRSLSKVNRRRMLFSFSEIEEQYKEYLTNWFQRAEVLKPIYDLYFGTVSSSSMYLEHQFLSLAQALESYHRRTHKGSYLEKSVFRESLQRMRGFVSTLADVPEETREIFCSKMAFLNEYTLRTRLIEILHGLGGVVHLLIPNIDEFAKSATNTRNYLTHYDEELKEKSVKGPDLDALIQQMKFILELCFLKELGMSDERIQALANKHQHYLGLRHTLGIT